MFSNAQNDLANLLMGQQLLTQFKPTSNNLLPSTPDASNMSINPLNLLAMNPFLLNLNVNPNLNQNADKGFGQDLNFNMHSPLSMTPTLNTPLSINAQMNFNSPGTDYNLLAQMLQYQLLQNTLNLPKQDICNNGLLKVEENHNIFASPQITPLTPKGKKRSNMETMNCKEKKSRQMRKLTANDTETNSPVSGMFIKETCDLSAEELQKQADIDDTAAFVDVSLESRAEVAKIQAAHADKPNWPLNESRCALCRVNYQDVFKLAMHRCPRIIHEEYPCPECDKSFACAANLQSHRRWHKPKSTCSKSPLANQYTCTHCLDSFDTKKTMKKHVCTPRSLSENSNKDCNKLNLDLLNSSEGITLLASCFGFA